MYPSTRPLLDTRLSRLLQNYKSFLKKISPKRRQIRTFGGTHKFAGDFLDKVPENRARPLVSQQAQRNLRGLSPFAKGELSPKGTERVSPLKSKACLYNRRRVC